MQPASKDSANYFLNPYPLGKKTIRGRFVIPSGIRCTRASTIAQTFRCAESVGVITTKSISVAPKAGYREPIYARYSTGSYINAVGLSNPGAEAFAKELRSIRIPPDKFLLVSIFGGRVEDFVTAARMLSDAADGFELNMSCPHAAGYGIELGQDSELVAAITRAVVETVSVPVIVKLSAMLPGLKKTALASIQSGAGGITVSNTVGPSRVDIGTSPILSNKVGGLSGNAIRPLALNALDQVRKAIGPEPVIIGMGGIGAAEHIEQFKAAGADLFGIGSALTGMNSEQFSSYFRQLENEVIAVPANLPIGVDGPDSAVPMSYHRCKVEQITSYTGRLYSLTVDSLPNAPSPGDLSGQYYFLTVPGAGEKPFALFSCAERSFIVKKVGSFTEYLAEMPQGAEILVRGPYGKPVMPFEGRNRYVLAGGGTGIASLLEMGIKLHATDPVVFILGAATKDELFGMDLFRQYGLTIAATEDGTEGFHGRVSGALQDYLQTCSDEERASHVHISCGPERMIEACAAIQLQYAPPERIVGAVEYQTSCGVGICGKCASPSGHLSCIDGPFMQITNFGIAAASTASHSPRSS